MPETIAPHAPIGEIAATHPVTIPILQRHGIDFCCGGAGSLEQAAGRAGLELEGLLAELQEAAAKADPAVDVRWDAQPVPALLDHLLATHHEYTKESIRELPKLADKVVAAHGSGHPELAELRSVLRVLLGELELHLRKEEEVLFPMLRGLAEGGGTPMDPRAPIGVMEREHDEAGGMLRRMRGLSGGAYAPPEDACPTWRAYYKWLDEFEADLHRHIHLENNVLHKRARAFLESGGADAL